MTCSFYERLELSPGGCMIQQGQSAIFSTLVRLALVAPSTLG